MLGLTVAQLRSERGWTQDQLAARAGLTQSHIELIEHCTHHQTGGGLRADGLAGWERLRPASDSPPLAPPHE